MNEESLTASSALQDGESRPPAQACRQGGMIGMGSPGLRAVIVRLGWGRELGKRSGVLRLVAVVVAEDHDAMSSRAQKRGPVLARGRPVTIPSPVPSGANGEESRFEGKATTIGMGELEPLSMQEQSRRSGVFSERSVLGFVAVLGVSDDGVSEVAQMEPDLMIATRVRRTAQKGEPCRGVTGDRVIEFATDHRGKGGPCHFRGARHSFRQWLSDASRGVHESANHSEVFLDGLAGFELSLASVDGFRILAEDDDAAGGFVESMNWVKPAFDMLPKHIQQVLRFMSIEGCSVN